MNHILPTCMIKTNLQQEAFTRFLYPFFQVGTFFQKGTSFGNPIRHLHYFITYTYGNRGRGYIPDFKVHYFVIAINIMLLSYQTRHDLVMYQLNPRIYNTGAVECPTMHDSRVFLALLKRPDTQQQNMCWRYHQCI